MAEEKLLDKVKTEIRTRHYSKRTEQAYAGWIKRFILFHNKRHSYVKTYLINEKLNSSAFGGG